LTPGPNSSTGSHDYGSDRRTHSLTYENWAMAYRVNGSGKRISTGPLYAALQHLRRSAIVG
jgi:hypothetical protein